MSDSMNSSIEALFSKMENFISTKTVVGEPITVGNITIVPLIDVSFGVGAGASGNKTEKDNKANKAKNMGGLGAKITPSAILVIQNGTVQLVNIKNTGSVDKLLNMVPGILSKFNFKSETSVDDKYDEDDSM